MSSSLEREGTDSAIVARLEASDAPELHSDPI